MSRASVVLTTLGVAVFSVALAIPTQSASRVSVSTGGPDLVDGSSALTIVAVEEPVVIVTLPASPAAPPASKPPVPVAVLGVANGPGTVVVASWYGPGFYGNRTACGQTYTPELLGVAHRTLPCGTLLRLEYGGRVVTVPVVDRGPYIAGRTLDLSNATRSALGCSDLCPVRMQ